MGQRSSLRRREAEDWSICPSCGREAVGLVTGQCNHCLQPLAWGGSRSDPGRILDLREFERARATVRRGRGWKGMRVAGATLVGLVVGALLVGLFLVAMTWLESFMGRGTAWRG